MSVSVRNAQSNTSGGTSSTSIVANAPTGLASGDTMLANLSISSNSSPTITPPSGWDLITTQIQGTTLRQYVYYKVAGGSEPASYTWSYSTPSPWAINVTAYIGVDNNNPIAGFVAHNGGATTTPAHGAVIPQAETCYGVICGTSRNTAGTATVSTPSSGYSTEADTVNSVSPFTQAYMLDQHTTYGLPLTTVTPGTDTLSRSSTYNNVVVFLRPTVATITGGFSVDVATFASEVTDTAGGVTTLAFSTGYSNETLVAVIAGDAGTASNMTVSGGSLTWVRQVSQITAHGSSYLYTAAAASPLSGITVTCSDTGDTTTSVGVTLYSLLGVNSSTPIGASTLQNTGTAGAMNLSVTTTGNNSWVWANYNDYTANTAPTAGTAQTKVSDIANSGDGNRYAAFRQNAITASSGTSVTMNTTAPTADSILAFGFEIMGAAAPSVTLGSTLLTMGVG